MSTVDSDSDVRLSAEFSARERQLWLARQQLAEQAAALATAQQRLEAELAEAKRQRAQPANPTPPVREYSAESALTEEAAPSAQRWLPHLSAMPGWLVSLVLHLATLILLGLFLMPEVLNPTPAVLVIAAAEPVALETIEEVIIAPPLENLEHQVVDAPAGEFSELTNVTEEIEAGASSTATNSTDLDAVDVGEMQDLFGHGGQGLKDVGGGKGSAEFFGVKAGGRRFVFIVDSSNSMRGDKFQDAKEELMYAVRRLDKQQMFYVIFFDNDALCMFSDAGKEAEARPVPASIANIRKLENWLKTVENERRTDPYDAVKIALKMRPDAIFLLSDGQFTDRGQTERYLAESNVIDDPIDGRRPRVVVHTIGFYSKDGEITLEAIAKAYQGSYRFVPRPMKR